MVIRYLKVGALILLFLHFSSLAFAKGLVGPLENDKLDYASEKLLNDGIRYSKEQKKGLERFVIVQKTLPILNSSSLKEASAAYFTLLADAFYSGLPYPKRRFHFVLADTLNPTLWPLGGGYFVVHAGLLNQKLSFQAIQYIFALSMAHDYLGHHEDIGNEWNAKGSSYHLENLSKNYWSAENFAYLILSDPFFKPKYSYTANQQSNALELVYKFFVHQRLDFNAAQTEALAFFSTVNSVVPLSSLVNQHRELKFSSQLPHFADGDLVFPRWNEQVQMIDQKLYENLERLSSESRFQKYKWIRFLIPYSKFFIERSKALESFVYSPSARSGIETDRYKHSTLKPFNQTIDQDELELNSINENYFELERHPEGRLARLFIRGFIYRAHHEWAKLYKTAESALQISPQSEPFLFELADSALQQGRFNLALKHLIGQWPLFENQRLLLRVQAQFLEGRITEALKEAKALRRSSPSDSMVLFWELLCETRLKRDIEKTLRELDVFYGLRPSVRAIHSLYYAHRKKLDLARKALEIPVGLEDDPAYSMEEWGVFHFAGAWLKHLEQGKNTDLHTDLQYGRGFVQWPVSIWLKQRLPLEHF